MYFDTKEEAQAAGITRFRHYPTGEEVIVGDRVAFIGSGYESYGLANGDVGLVIGYSDQYPMIDWQKPLVGANGSYMGTNYEHRLNDRSGYTFDLNHLKFLERGKIPTEEEKLDLFVETVDKAPRTLIVDGKVYKLELAANAPAMEVKRQLLDSMATRIRTIRSQANAEIDKMRTKLDKQQLMPAITVNDAATFDIHLNVTNGYVAYLMPFHYTPKYIVTRDSEGRIPDREIKAETQKALKRDVFVNLLTKAGKVVEAGLYERLPNGSITGFYHYHGGGHDCLGSMGAFRTMKAETLADVISFRAEMEKMMEIVNYKSLLHRNPGGDFPDSEQLLRDSKPLKQEVAWSASPKELKVGDLVEIIEPIDSFPPHMVGTIGRVVNSTRGGEYNYGIEFAVNFGGHDCDGKCRHGYGYNFPDRCLLLAREGAVNPFTNPTPADTGEPRMVPPATTDRPAAPFGSGGIRLSGAASVLETIAAQQQRTPENCPANERGEKFPAYGYELLQCTRCGRNWGDHHDWLCEDQYQAWMQEGRVIQNTDTSPTASGIFTFSPSPIQPQSAGIDGWTTTFTTSTGGGTIV